MRRWDTDPATIRPDLRRRALQGMAVAAIVLAGCFATQATVRYQPQDASLPTEHTARWSFDADAPGALPSGARVLRGEWAVRAAPQSPSSPHVLCQTGAALAPLLLLTDAVYKDVVLTARLSALSTQASHKAGLVFDFQDADNYYVLEADARAATVNLYRNAGGRLTRLASGGAAGSPTEWQELRVEAVEQPGMGFVIRGFLNGRQVFQTTDETFKAGQLGLSTNGTVETCFDDVEARAR